MKSDKLIDSLIEQTKQIIKQVEKLKDYDLKILSWKENQTSWNMLECLEHLNLYGNFYLPEIETNIKHSNFKKDIEFKSGFLGNYFSKSMLPKAKLNKIKTFKNKNPLNARLDEFVIENFINQQTKLLDLLKLSRDISLNKIKIKTSISCLIKLKLGDTFQFLINHLIRHLSQIDGIQIKIKNA